MNRFLPTAVASLACVLVMALAAPCQDAGNKDMEAIQGAWLLTSTVFQGKKIEMQGKPPQRLVFQGFAMIFEQDKNLKAFFQLDPTKMPREIDIVLRKGDVQGKFLGIYSLEGNVLKLCMGKVRPKTFSATGVDYSSDEFHRDNAKPQKK